MFGSMPWPLIWSIAQLVLATVLLVVLVDVAIHLLRRPSRATEDVKRGLEAADRYRADDTTNFEIDLDKLYSARRKRDIKRTLALTQKAAASRMRYGPHRRVIR